MFEHLLRQALQQAGREDVVVESAGALKEAAGLEAEEGAVIALQGVGIDISSHRARWMGNLQFTQYDYIYCMDPGVVPMVQAQMATQGAVDTKMLLVNEPDGVPNPYGKDQAAYQWALEVTQCEVQKLLSAL